MRLHLDGGYIAGGDADVSAGILNLDGGIGRNLCIQNLLVQIVLGQAKGVEEVVVESSVLVAPLRHPRSHVIPAGRKEAQNTEQDQQADEAAATANRGLSAHINRPQI